MGKLPTLDELHREIAQLRRRHALPSHDQAFVFWYCSVALTGSDEQARLSLFGGKADVNVDALYIDEPARRVFVVQGKYRSNEKAGESRNDLIALRSLGENLTSKDKAHKEAFERLLSNADPLLGRRLTEARERIRRRGYYLCLRFVSTGRVAPGLFEEFQETSDSTEFMLFDGLRVRRVFRDYLDGAAPPVPFVDMALDLRDTVRRYDKENGIESWVVTVTAAEIARLYRKTGPRIFARNIRGFLGSTEINKGMSYTLRQEPEKFWYYNNGVTIVCDKAIHVQERGENRLRIENPQIINGQQTTRVLAENPSSRASVLVRVTAFRRETTEGEEVFGRLLENVVAATNRQNPIYASDLRANDSEQVRLERELFKRHYLYVRKRQTKREARRHAPQKTWWTITRDQMAQALGACFLDPYEVRLGKENLFETDNYPRIFSGRPIPTYLGCSWLRTVVRRRSKGRPERAYAAWLVLHMLWQDLTPRFPGVRQQEDLVYFLEREAWDSPPMKSLSLAVDQLFRGALRFYRRYRGSGEEAADISTFFRVKNLHNRFSRFWSRSSNRLRSEYRRKLDRFVKAVHALAEDAA